jgi:serine/threonine-protein kinase
MVDHDEGEDDGKTVGQPPVLGDFELLDKLGGGGMGIVYRARQRSMDRDVAVKVLHPHLAADSSFVDRFYREAKASGKLTHPNIIRGIAAGEAGGRFYFAMEFVDGETAADLLKQRGRISATEVAKIGLEVAQALQHAHSRQIVHRDIKPSNIMIDREGVVKVADLGLAKATSEDSGLTEAGAVYGTPAYMAPEQASDAANADHRSDIYALGATLYHLLTGTKPFAGKTILEVLDAKRSGTYRRIREYEPSVPEALERIIDKMMRADPRQRFQSAAEIVAAFEVVGITHVAVGPEKKPPRQRRWRPLMGVAGGVALLGAAAIALLVLSTPSSSPDPRPSDVPSAERVAAEAPQENKPVALGVMLFKSHGGAAEEAWKREALRDGLNAQLSRLSQVKVYSKEFIDFLMTRKGLTEIEAATELGIKKMLSGSVVATGGEVRVETHIVDVATGVLDASYTTTGNDENFLDLPNKLAMEAITRLDLPVTDEERQILLAQQDNSTAEALKLLLEAEASGGKKPEALGPRSDTAPPAIRRASARLLGAWPAAAYAQEDPNPQGEIEALLESYRNATEARQVDKLATLYTGLSKEQEEAQRRYFQNVRDLRVAIDAIDVAIAGEEAVVSYTRTDDFVDARTGRPMHVAVRLTKLLRKDEGAWKLVGEE